MKKVLASITLMSLAVPMLVLAQPPVVPPKWGEGNVWGVLDKITNYVFFGLLIIAAISIMIAGYNFITAAGDPDKTKTARNFVLYALIGVLVGFLAKGLIYFVENIVRP